MIAKLIATAETREAARQRALAALRSYPILGIRTNVAFLIALLEHPRFVSGELDTHFLEHEGSALRASLLSEPSEHVLAVAGALLPARPGRHGSADDLQAGQRRADDDIDPWTALHDVRV